MSAHTHKSHSLHQASAYTACQGGTIVDLADGIECSPSAAFVPFIVNSSCCLLCSIMTDNDVTSMSVQMQILA